MWTVLFNFFIGIQVIKMLKELDEVAKTQEEISKEYIDFLKNNKEAI